MKRVIALFTLLALSACSKLTMSNYDQLKAGMSYRDVVEILGNADRCEDLVANRECIWGNKDGRHIQVNFVAGAAVYFNQSSL
ncbi:DUF3862 domain-containing protein [Bowmanella sp. Y26]|uniref:DUF3862 domain-containing protein n=2 Tax=Bowmanella yangjiangensis TaxID=2811230 RepID=A0ABS3CTY1_9ALTE|nr:DUF3862 domain-containing protein [Bowmanella yangjiangensis]MBN7820577.1 DUF3862 domain-containing protein [Bowmanella yangjiangensis]MBT1063781.1 DUF3862 domain-containing protein [Bowmanella yangjiangensis]